MDDPVNLSLIQPPFSAVTSSLERTPDDPAVKTIEFLRARLLSERSVSKAAREHTQELGKKILELEQRLEYEVQLRKQLQKVRAEILSKYKDELSEHLCLEDLEALGVDDSVSEQGSNGNSSHGKENHNKEGFKVIESDAPNDCSRQPASLSEKRTLAWFPRRDSRSPRQLKSFSHSTFFTSNDMDSPRRTWSGKSVRKMRNKEGRDQDSRLEDGNMMNVNGQNNIRYEEISEMERILERQSELIEQFEAEEDAQRAWEEKFQEQKMSNRGGKKEQNIPEMAIKIHATDNTSMETLDISAETEDKIPSVVEGEKLVVEDTAIGSIAVKNENYKNPQEEISIGETVTVLEGVDARDTAVNDKISETDSKDVIADCSTTMQSETISTNITYSSTEHTGPTTAGNQKTEIFKVHLEVSQGETSKRQLDGRDNVSSSPNVHSNERPVSSNHGYNVPHNEKHHISFIPTDRRESPSEYRQSNCNHHTMQQNSTMFDDSSNKSGTGGKNISSFPRNMYGFDYSDDTKRSRHLESQYPHFDMRFQQQVHNFDVRNASHPRIDPWRQVPYQHRGRQMHGGRVMDVLRALQMAKQEIERSEDQYVYNAHVNFDPSQHLRMMGPFLDGRAEQGAATVPMPGKYVGRETKHPMSMPHAWRVGIRPGQTDPTHPPYTMNRR